MYDEFRKTIEASDLVRNDTAAEAVQVVVSPDFVKAILEADRFIRTSKTLLGTRITSLVVEDPDFASDATKGPYSRTVTIDGIGVHWHDSYPGGRSVAYIVPVGEIEDHAVKIGLVHPLAAHWGSYEVPLDNAYVVSNIENEVRSFAQRAALPEKNSDDGDVANDMINSILHWHMTRGGDIGETLKAAQCGIGSFLTEHYDPEDRHMDSKVEIQVEVPDAGVSVWVATASRAVVDIEEPSPAAAPASAPVAHRPS